MKRKQKIQVKQVNDSLHINLRGKISPDVCAQLVLVMERMYQGYGKIFVNTSGITSVEPKSKEAVGRLIRALDLPENKIYFSGKSASAICHSKSKQRQVGLESENFEPTVDSIFHHTDCHGVSILGDLDFLWDEQPESSLTAA